MSVLSYLTDCASQAILSEEENGSINTSINAIFERLHSYFEDDLFEIIPFGSYTRDTILPRSIDDKSDIDLMVVFKDSKIKPQSYLTRLKQFTEYYYSSSVVSQSNPTIILSLNHIKFDLVPAIKSYFLGSATKDLFKIPAPAKNYVDWLETNPTKFNKLLTDKNLSHKNLIKPLIRLVKYWNSQNQYVYDSYLMEKRIIDNVTISKNLKNYFYSFINGLDSSVMPQTKQEKIRTTKKIIQRVIHLENNDYEEYAELEIQRILPMFWA